MIIDVPEFKDGVVLFGHGDEGDCDHAGRHDNDDEDCDVERNYHDIVAVMVASFCTMMLISHTHTQALDVSLACVDHWTYGSLGLIFSFLHGTMPHQCISSVV